LEDPTRDKLELDAFEDESLTLSVDRKKCHH